MYNNTYSYTHWAGRTATLSLTYKYMTIVELGEWSSRVYNAEHEAASVYNPNLC